MLPKLNEGQKCPTCGQRVCVPMHSCHPIRDNYAVTKAAKEACLKPRQPLP